MLRVGRFASTIQLPHRSKSFIEDFLVMPQLHGKLIVYNPDERTSVRGDAGTATIYWTIPGQVFWSISSNISGPMVFSGSVSTTAGDYCPLNGISFDGYVSGLVDVQMMPGSNYATLEGSMLDIQGVSYVLPGVEAYMYH